MVGPTENRAIPEELKRLGSVLEELVESLRAQREVLRQRGMSLPLHALGGLKEAQTEMEEIAEQVTSDSVELDQLRALAETTALVNSSLDIDQVLNEVMDRVIQLTGAERGYIVLRNDTTGEMEFRIARNIDRKTLDEGGFIISRTIVEEVARTGQPVVTTNAQSDPRFAGQESVMIYALRSILCVPLIVKDTIIGVVYADNRIRDALFAEKELSLLVAFANQAATAIENARLFDNVQRALAEITDMKKLLDNVFTSIASGVITTDVNNIVTTYNLAAEHILDIHPRAVLGYPLTDALPIIYTYVKDLLDLVYQQSYQEIVEIDPVLPQRGETNLTLKLTPLKNDQETEGVAIVVDDLTEIKKRDATLEVVRRYLPPAMVDNLQNLDGLGLGGERRVITVLFVETRPFHMFSPDLLPHELMEQLNLYLTVAAEAIHHQNGVIDKFMGNEVMGLFNTPLNPSDDHSWWAIQAALKMVEDFRALSGRIGEGPTSYYRMGIHTGVATLGNLGSATRRDFSAIGDTVNLAKRLQENAQHGQIIVSDDTYRDCQTQLSDPAHDILVLQRASIQVKGRRQATQIYEIRRSQR